MHRSRGLPRNRHRRLGRGLRAPCSRPPTVGEFARFFLGPPARRSVLGMATVRARFGPTWRSSWRSSWRPTRDWGAAGHGPLRAALQGLQAPLLLGRRRWAALVGGAVVVAATGALASPAEPTSTPIARDAGGAEPVATKLQHSRVLPYPSDQVWPTTIRYLRVDRGFAVIDRDRDAGFILFEFPVGSEGGSKGSGSIELVDTTDPSGRRAVKLQISTDAGPLHMPHAIAEGLAAKLKTEHGQPAPPPPSAPPSPTPTPPPEAPDDGPWVPEEPAQ